MTNRKFFLNLPTSDLSRAIAFHQAIGHIVIPAFTDGETACLRMGEDLYTMIHAAPRFAIWSPVPASDTQATAGALYTLSCTSRAEVDAIVARAVAAGGTTYKEPMDMAGMYGHAFRDPDGNVWELGHMDTAAVPPEPEWTGVPA